MGASTCAAFLREGPLLLQQRLALLLGVERQEGVGCQLALGQEDAPRQEHAWNVVIEN